MYTSGEIAANIASRRRGSTRSTSSCSGRARRRSPRRRRSSSTRHCRRRTTSSRTSTSSGRPTAASTTSPSRASTRPGSRCPGAARRTPSGSSATRASQTSGPLGGLFDRALMQGVPQIVGAVLKQIKDLSDDEKCTVLSEQASAVMNEMPPRENQRVNMSLDSVHATGPLGHVHCVLRGTCNYKQTGVLQAYAAHHLVRGAPRRVGFASACQAFGHRELLGRAAVASASWPGSRSPAARARPPSADRDVVSRAARARTRSR